MNSRYLYLAVVTILAGGVFVFISGSSQLGSETEVVFRTSSDSVSIQAEVANTTRQIRHGLMNRDSLPRDEGMIFVFDREGDRAFWMKNTSIPLDIIFLDSEGRIVGISQADPEPGTSEENLTLYTSPQPAKYVIEVNQGFSREHGIRVGDEVSTPGYPPGI